MNLHVLHEDVAVGEIEQDIFKPHEGDATTFWIVDPERKFYKDLYWFHKGGNLLGVSGHNAHKVRKYIQANELAYLDIPWLEVGGNNTQPAYYFAFRNGHQNEQQHRQTDELFDRLITHFRDSWYTMDGFVFDEVEQYRR